MFVRPRIVIPECFYQESRSEKIFDWIPANNVRE